MASSDSDDFESADEGISSSHKRERKKRLSSSNYSDNISDQETKKTVENNLNKKDFPINQTTDAGWDDFDVDEECTKKASESKMDGKPVHESKNDNKKEAPDNTGWDDFDDWGDTNVIDSKPVHTDSKQSPAQAKPSKQDNDLQSVTEKLANTSMKSDSWGWGWGVDSLLNTATAGISTITSHVSQGISTVLETGIGAPDPEELARKTVNDERRTTKSDSQISPNIESKPDFYDTSFPFGSLFSGVSKFVETTGTKVISGGLDTLETIGKKTMEVLQDGDPGLAKKRAMLGLDSGDKPVLSQLLREAKSKADEEDKIREAKREAKEVHYETLFDDYEGLVHLEALEMLSKQVSLRIDERLRTTAPEKRQDIRETLQQVAELCEMPEEDEDEDDDEDDEGQKDTTKSEAFHEKLQKATKDIGLKLQFLPLIKQYTEILDWLEKSDEGLSDRATYKRAVSGLAQATALAVELYHKTAEMLLVKSRRSTADEADALTQMTVVLTKHISDLAVLFTQKLNGHETDDKEQANNYYITNVFLEAGNSSKYIENAFQLTLPIIQIGAV